MIYGWKKVNGVTDFENNVSTTVVDRPGLPLVVYPDSPAAYDRPDLDDVFAAISRLPEPRLLSEVKIVDHLHPINQETEHAAKVHSQLSVDRTATLFQPNREDLLDTLLFEWFAVLFDANPQMHEFFRLAGREKLELPGFENIDTERKTWAVLGAQLFKVSDETALLFSMANPFRSAVIGRCVTEQLELMNETDMNSQWHENMARALLVDFTAASVSIKLLSEGDDNRLLTFMQQQRNLL